MNPYKVKKILSNNVLLAEQEGKECILIGKGIGFGVKKEDLISADASIEKKFFSMSEENRLKYKQLLQYTDKEVIATSEEIIALAAKELGEELNEHIHIALADHINFFIKRLEEGIDIANPFIAEIESLYAREYVIAQKGAKLIAKRLNVEVPENEVGFITLHIHSGRVNRPVGKALENAKLYHQIVELIEREANITIDPKSINYARMITHIRFALERLRREQVGTNILLDNIRKQFPREYQIAVEISKIIGKFLGVQVPEDEIGYIAIHVYRVIESEKMNNEF